jgi:hypothetical protein
MATNAQNNRTKQQGTTTHDAGAFGNGEAAIAGPSQLLKVVCANKSASALWLCFFDGPTATGTPRLAPIAIAAGATAVIDLSTVSGDGWCGVSFASALTWAASTSATFSQDSSSSLWPTLVYLA